jgi:hypothetical protein
VAAVATKLREIYAGKGIKPADVAEDMQQEPTLAQGLAHIKGRIFSVAFELCRRDMWLWPIRGRGHLQAAGLIHYYRGKITVLDRPKLEAQVCECYAMVKREYDRLLSLEVIPNSVAV